LKSLSIISSSDFDVITLTEYGRLVNSLHDRIIPVISRMTAVYRSFSRQFWLVSLVMMLAWTFHSLVWPFLTVYASERLNQPLTAVTMLLTINSLVGLVSTFIGGAIADRFGRKWVIVFSFVFSAISWYLFRMAGTLPVFALLMALSGAFTPLYRLASDAMITDVVPVDERIEAYSILRMGNNIGVAVGPAIGGFLAAHSYDISFTVTGLGLLLCAVLFLVFSIETMPRHSQNGEHEQIAVKGTGYGDALKDRGLLGFLAAMAFNRMASATLWMLLAVHAKSNYGIPEDIFGFIPTTNAIMVILFQILITRKIKRYPASGVMTIGALFYAVAVFGVAFGRGFWGFWLCMVIATIGEMILLPTSTNHVSRLAPEDKRARYMSLYTITWSIGTALGPLVGGLLNDGISPSATWIGTGLLGLVGTGLFALFSKRPKNTRYCE
jgi:MFS family permease